MKDNAKDNARAQAITEWLKFLRDALRFGATQERAAQIADVLTYGEVR